METDMPFKHRDHADNHVTGSGQLLVPQHQEHFLQCPHSTYDPLSAFDIGWGKWLRKGCAWHRLTCHAFPATVCLCSKPRVQRFLPPTPGTDATCFIHAAI